MKGTVLRPQWPAPANNDSKADSNAGTAESEAMSRITLALLDEYSLESGTSGYDPYNTDVGPRSDVWRRKPKRD